jgi:DNA-binding CsgD family transcriptional regulator
VLETLAAFIPATLALAFTVDEHGLVGDVMALWPHGRGDRPATKGVERLHRLELIDAHARRHGFDAPLVTCFRRGARVVAGVVLLRDAGSPPFDPAAVRLVRELHPLMQEAFICGAPPAAAGRDDLLARLTAREAEVACMVCGGVSNACIAAALGMTEATVKSHLTRIYAKAGVRSRTDLAVKIGRRS